MLSKYNQEQIQANILICLSQDEIKPNSGM